MAEKDSGSSSGIGFCGALTILFVGLKLTNHIDWGWGWVLGPLWIPFVTVMTVGIAFIILATIWNTLAYCAGRAYVALFKTSDKSEEK